MRKKLFAVLMMLGTASMLCGFDSAETVDSVMQKQQEAAAAVTSTDAEITVNADVAVNLDDATLTAKANGTIDMEVVLAEQAAKVEGSIDVLSPLLAQENTYEFKLYAKPNESGAVEVYLYTADSVTGESEWEHDSSADMGINLNDLTSTATTITVDKLAQLGINFTLAPEAADVDGTECYEVSTVIDSTTFSTILTAASALSGQDLTEDESVAMAMEILDGLKINLAYYIDTTTFLPVKMHMDMNDSDLAAIEQLLSAYITSSMQSEETIAVTIALNDLSMDMTSVYDTITEIVIPDEALYAGSSADVIPDEVEAEISTAVESVTEAAAQ